MSLIAYYRVSTTDQSVAAQRAALTQHIKFDIDFVDNGVSGAVFAADRPGISSLLNHIREGDTLHVYAVDGLGGMRSTCRALALLLPRV